MAIASLPELRTHPPTPQPGDLFVPFRPPSPSRSPAPSASPAPSPSSPAPARLAPLPTPPPSPLDFRPRRLPTRTQLLSVLLAAVLVTAAIVVVIVVLGTGSPFQGQITNTYPAGASAVVVDVTVTNSSGSPALPTCQIELASPGRLLTGIGATGIGSFTAGGLIPAKGSMSFHGLVSVTDGPPEAVTVGASSVICR